MIDRQSPSCITIAIALVLLGAGSAHAQQKNAGAQKKLYCWNENGRRVCGDALPAEAADAARTELSARSGLRTGQVERALTGSERVAAAQAADLASRQAEVEARRTRRDLAMVESYITEADLRRAYGERTSLLDESLKASQMGVTNLRLSLLGLLRQAGDQELGNNSVPKKLADSIHARHGELRKQQQIQAVQQRDRAELESELADAVQRYRALKALSAPDAGDPAPPPAPTPAA